VIILQAVLVFLHAVSITRHLVMSTDRTLCARLLCFKVNSGQARLLACLRVRSRGFAPGQVVYNTMGAMAYTAGCFYRLFWQLAGLGKGVVGRRGLHHGDFFLTGGIFTDVLSMGVWVTPTAAPVQIIFAAYIVLATTLPIIFGFIWVEAARRPYLKASAPPASVSQRLCFILSTLLMLVIAEIPGLVVAALLFRPGAGWTLGIPALMIYAGILLVFYLLAARTIGHRWVRTGLPPVAFRVSHPDSACAWGAAPQGALYPGDEAAGRVGEPDMSADRARRPSASRGPAAGGGRLDVARAGDPGGQLR
jgi:hypothetical protein